MTTGNQPNPDNGVTGAVLSCRDVAVSAGEATLVKGFDLEVRQRETVSLVGPSGSGKTTVLNCVAGLWPVDVGSIVVDGFEMTGSTHSQTARIRRSTIGFVFQFGELLPELNVAENVELPALLAGAAGRSAAGKVSSLLASVDLAGFEHRDVTTLSGGETQRVAIARALVNEPKLLLADEPTGAVDEAQSREIIGLLVASARARGAGLLVATHDPAVAEQTDRVIALGHFTTTSG